MLRAAKYLKQYLRPDSVAVTQADSSYVRDGQRHLASVFRPAHLQGRAPAFILLHGMAYRGIRHPALVRLASALAASGHVVFIPEIHEWTRLLIAPGLTGPTIEASVDALRVRGDVDPDRIGVFGFSFGATQALIAAREPWFERHIRAIVAWGGYADFTRLVHFGLTGEHELDGIREFIDTDPYGAWLFGGNYLTWIPGYEDMTAVSSSALELAREAGRSGVFAGDSIHRASAASVAATLSPREREVFEIFAPPAPRDLADAREMAAHLGRSVIAKDPLVDPTPFLSRARVPVLLAHGRDDRLVPYTESIRLERGLPHDLVVASSITALFSHSGGTVRGLGVMGRTREAARFVATLDRILKIL
jgi:pimeloyl-ACP methyl ester carboxylesterase